MYRLNVAIAVVVLSSVAAVAAQGYEGVVPNSNTPPPRVARVARESGVVLSWPGFVAEGGGRFFVQSNHPIVPTVQFLGDRVELTFPRARVHLANSVRWLETQHFNTPVVRARLERRRHDVVLVLHLRTPMQPSVTQANSGNFAYTYVDFPAGSYLPAPAPTPAGTTNSMETNERPPSVDLSNR